MTEPVTWTDDRIARLTELWRAGKSATQIAVDLGGVSRNAVMGKVHRLNLHNDARHGAVSDQQKAEADKKRLAKRQQVERDREASRIRREAAAQFKAAKVAKMAAHRPAPPPIASSIARPAPLNSTLIQLGNNDCRWPVEGEKAATLFCGHKVEAGGSYCTYHARVAYIPREVRLKKKRAA